MSSAMEWLEEVFDNGFSVTFAEGLEARELLLRLGCDAESLEMIDQEDAEERQLEDDDVTMIRAGVHDGWAFAVQAWGARVFGDGVLEKVSAGTRALAVVSTASIPWFTYCEDTDEVCGFDPGMPWIRHGSDPDRFDSVMAEVGLNPSAQTPEPGSVAGMLKLAERAFGVGLPYEDVVTEELLGGVVPE
ncbi:DUF6461 domain-containing protein [Kitasatospora sp. NPDC056651]|uniref:DUF6461 domain-containing protein n=1 Tax=Kitasatospora sp. NPDC056651 TaxID=3345892 RepID=UPI0036BAC32A